MIFLQTNGESVIGDLTVMIMGICKKETFGPQMKT